MVNTKLSLTTAAALLFSVAAAHDGAFHHNLSSNKRHAAYIERMKLRSDAPVPPTRVVARQDAGVPPISQISSGMPSATPSTIFTSFAPGATPSLKGAPVLPAVKIDLTKYPEPDKIPPTDGAPIQAALAKMRAANIPNLPVTKDGSCESDPALVANASASGSCWWTCGGCTRDTDISVCPDKNTWGVSFDDGPSEYTNNLLNYLHTKDLKATFFVVGSRVVYNPQILQAEHMLGHEISIHTWSHSPLTTLTNEQIVAELTWTGLVIKEAIGVTPLTFRPPYGDLDDRVRAVAKSLDLTPIQWTGSGETEFDTDDWRIPGGTATGPSSLAAFTKILEQAASLNTGFIVLEHDLYQQTVDMGVGYFIPLAQQKQFTLKSIHDCLNQPLENSYVETSGSGGNSTVPGGNTSMKPSGSGTNRPTGTNTRASGTATNTPGAAPVGAQATSMLVASGALLAALGVLAGAFA